MPLPTIQVRCLGMGSAPYDDVTLEVTYFAQFLRGPDNTCAFCHGDPCGETSKTSDIAKLLKKDKWQDCCPCCKGSAT